MPAPIPLALTRIDTRPADAPPPPPPGFFEGLFDSKVLGANVRLGNDEVPGHLDQERFGAYEGLIGALVEKGQSPSRYQYPNPAALYSPTATPIIDYDSVVADAHRLGIAGVPETRAAFDLQWQGRMQQRQARDAGTAARGGMASRLVGGMAGSMTDPVNIATLPFGGFGKSLAMRLLTEGAVQAGVQAVELPGVNIERQRQGRPAMTGSEAALSIATAAAGGVVFRGLAEAPAAARVGFERAVAAHWDKLPAALQERWTARGELSPGDGEALVADMAEQIIGRDNMGETEHAAADWIRRGAQVDAASPFVPNGRAAELHPQLLAEAMRRVLDETPAAPPVRGPSRFASGTAIASNTVQTFDVAPDAQARFMQRVRRAESRGDDAAANPRSSASGRYQFTDGTWLAYYKRRYGEGGLSDAQILAKKGDGALQDRLMADLTADNAAFLRSQGEAVSEGNLYLVHFAGQRGARKLFEAEPGARVEDVLGADVVRRNPFLAGKTAQDTIAWANRAMGQAPAPRAGARAEVAQGVPAREALQQEIDSITARMDALAGERHAAEGDLTVEQYVDGYIAGQWRGADVPPHIEQFAANNAAAIEAEFRARAEGPTAAPLDASELHQRDAALPDEPSFLPDLRKVVADKGRSLNDHHALAEELGVTPERVRHGLDRLAASGEIARRSDGHYTRKAPGPSGPDDLLRFIARNGGLSYDGLGEKARAAGHKGDNLKNTGSLRHFVPGGGPLLRPTGHGIDEMGEKLWDAGYFGPPETTPRPSEAEVLAAVEHSIRTGEKRFSFYEAQGAAPERAPAFEPDPGLADVVATLRAWVPAAADEAPEVLEYAAELTRSHDMDLDEALSRAINDYAGATRELALAEHPEGGYEVMDYEWPFDSEPGGENLAARGDSGGPEGVAGDAAARGDGSEDAAAAAVAGYREGERLADLPAEQRAPFLDPGGDAAKAQADSLAHDAKAAVERRATDEIRSNVAADATDETLLSVIFAEPTGEPGLRVERVPGMADDDLMSAVFRDETGAPKGVLYFPATPAGLRFNIEHGFGLAVYVDPAFRRQGIASKLYDEAAKIAPWINDMSGSGDLTPAGAEFARARRAGHPLDLEAAVDPNLAAVEKQRTQLAAEAPLQAGKPQESTLGFGLFGAADGVRLDAEGEARPLKDLLDDLDAEAAEIKAIRDCL
jgi:GNAT superfamily N-acetyltransferase